MERSVLLKLDNTYRVYDSLINYLGDTPATPARPDLPILLISESTFTFTLFKQKTHRCFPHKSLLGVAGVAGVAALLTFYIYLYIL